MRASPPAQKPKDKVLVAKPPIVKPLDVIKKPKKSKYRRMTTQQKDELIMLYASGRYTYRDLEGVYGFDKASIHRLVTNNNDIVQRIKKENKVIMDDAWRKLSSKTMQVAIDKSDKLSAYQAVLASAVAYDKLHPQTANINIGDNRSITVQYPNWYGSKRKKG